MLKLVVSSIATAVTYFAHPQTDGQAEYSWVSWPNRPPNRPIRIGNTYERSLIFVLTRLNVE